MAGTQNTAGWTDRSVLKAGMRWIVNWDHLQTIRTKIFRKT